MWKLLSVAAVASVALYSTAMAADLTAPASVSDPASFSWTGFYAGVMGTGGALHATVPAGYDEYYYGDYYGGGVDTTKFGGGIGGQIGANYQMGNFVFGADADISWLSLKASADGYEGYYQGEDKWDWYATAKLKAGVAVDNALIYVTGGAAVVKQKISACYYSDCNPSEGDEDTHVSNTKVGLAVGAGTDFALTKNLILQAEYLHIALPTSKYTPAYEGSGYQGNVDASADLVRLGLDWKFN